MRRLVTLCTAASMFFLVSCGDRLPHGVMTEQQMVDFLAEAYLLEGFYAIETNYQYESLTDEVVNSYRQLLEKHHVSQEQFEKSVEYYMHHPERYEAIHQQVIDRLDQMPSEQGPSADKTVKTNDTPTLVTEEE